MQPQELSKSTVVKLHEFATHRCIEGVTGCLCDVGRPKYEESNERSIEHHYGCWCVYCALTEARHRAWERNEH